MAVLFDTHIISDARDFNEAIAAHVWSIYQPNEILGYMV